MYIISNETKNTGKNMNLTININGDTTEDLSLALEEVTRFISEGFTKGFNKNDESGFHFDIEGEEKVVEDDS